MKNYTLMVNGDELYHHGVLGMKWGVRRYRNKDGSLTPEGIKKYRKDYETLRRIKSTPNHYMKSGIRKIDEFNEKRLRWSEEQFTKKLLKRIGQKGIADIEKSIIKEAKDYANEYRSKAIATNKLIDKTNIDLIKKYGEAETYYVRKDNLMLKLSQKDIDDVTDKLYKWYTDRYLIKKDSK